MKSMNGNVTNTNDNVTNTSVNKRGALIVLEGLDRSGKTTQAKLLLEHLKQTGQNARIQCFPDREEPTTGPIIDAFLRNAKSVGENQEAIHLLFSANRWLINTKMRQELESGLHLIVDRYSHSGIAYSLAKGMDWKWVCQPEIGLLRPDLVLFFDAHPNQVNRRGGFGQEALERSEFQQIVYEKMNKLFDGTYWRRINAALPIEQVHQSVLKEVSDILDNKKNTAGGDSAETLMEFMAADFGI